MTGKTFIERYQTEDVNKKVLSYVLDVALFATSINGLGIDDNITMNDLTRAVRYIDNATETGELDNIVAEAVDIVNTEIVQFFASYPDKLIDVQDALQEQVGDIDLLEAMKNVYINYAVFNLLPSFSAYLADIVEQSRDYDR